jgi:hypothetical protein
MRKGNRGANMVKVHYMHVKCHNESPISYTIYTYIYMKIGKVIKSENFWNYLVLHYYSHGETKAQGVIVYLYSSRLEPRTPNS